MCDVSGQDARHAAPASTASPTVVRSCSMDGTTRPYARQEARVDLSDARGQEAGYNPQRSPRAPALTTAAMLHVCRRNLRNGLEQDGTPWDAAE